MDVQREKNEIYRAVKAFGLAAQPSEPNDARPRLWRNGSSDFLSEEDIARNVYASIKCIACLTSVASSDLRKGMRSVGGGLRPFFVLCEKCIDN